MRSFKPQTTDLPQTCSCCRQICPSINKSRPPGHTTSPSEHSPINSNTPSIGRTNGLLTRETMVPTAMKRSSRATSKCSLTPQHQHVPARVKRSSIGSFNKSLNWFQSLVSLPSSLVKAPVDTTANTPTQKAVAVAPSRPAPASAKIAPRRDFLEAKQVSVYQLFDNDDFKFDIPLYQRPYRLVSIRHVRQTGVVNMKLRVGAVLFPTWTVIRFDIKKQA